MIDKRFVESFLRLNNVGAHAPPTEIKTVLTQAHWLPEEIEEAILTQSTDKGAQQALAQKRHEPVFRPDMDWSSSQLSSLLGTDVIIDPKAFHTNATKEVRVAHIGKKVFVGLCVTGIALAVAVGISVTLMYFSGMGPFFTPVEGIL